MNVVKSGEVLVLNTKTLQLEKKQLGEKGVTLDLMQEAVGGLIERWGFIPELEKAEIDLFLNEEGKLIDLKPTLALINDDKIVEMICGNLLFCGRRGPKNVGISLAQEGVIKEYLKSCKMGVVFYGDNKAQKAVVLVHELEIEK